MHEVRLSEPCIQKIDTYIRRYRESFESLYSDTGIWSEDQIIAQYTKESKTRRNEIVEVIEVELSEENVLGRTSETTTKLQWRSKVISLEWKTEGSTRIITEIQIR